MCCYCKLMAFLKLDHRLLICECEVRQRLKAKILFEKKNTRFMLIQDFENSNEQIPFMVKIENKNL